MNRLRPASAWLALNLALAAGTLAALALCTLWLVADSRDEPQRQAQRIQQAASQGLELAKGNPKLLQPLLAALPAEPLFAGLEIHGKSGRLAEIRYREEAPAWASRLPAATPIELPLDPKNTLRLRLLPAAGYPARRLAAAAPVALAVTGCAFLSVNLAAWLLQRRLRLGHIDESRWRTTVAPEEEAGRTPAPPPAELLDCIAAGVLRCDAQGRMSYLNAAARQLLETAADAPQPAGVLELIAPWDRRRCAELLERPYPPGSRQHLETQTVGSRRGVLPVAIDIMGAADASGDRILSIRDASAEHTLQETLKLRELVLDGGAQGLALVAPRDRGELRYANRAFMNLLNLGEAPAGGGAWIDKVAARLAPAQADQFRAALNFTAATALELSWQAGDGASRTLELQLLPVAAAEPWLVLAARDRSEDSARRRRLEEDLLVDRKILDEMPLAYCIADAQCVLRSANGRFAQLMGREPEQIAGSRIGDWVDRPGMPAGPLLQGDYRLVADPPGRAAKLSTVVLASPGREAEYVYFVDDITAFKQKALADSAELDRLQRTLDGIADGVITTNAGGFIQYLNPSAQRLTGLVEHQYKGMAFGQVVHLVDEKKREPLVDPALRAMRIGRTVKFRQDVLFIGDSRQELAVDVSAAPVEDRSGAVIGAVIVIKDVAEQRSLSQQMQLRASRDPLTGLINRRELLSLLETLQFEVEERSRQHTLCYMDLDKFKVVNDSCGHNAGDELLRQISHLMGECLRASDLLARIGGDEFCAVLTNTGADNGRAVAEKIREAVRGFRFTWDDKFFDLGISIGLFSLQRGLSVEEAINAADQACYQAKEAGRDRVYVAAAPGREPGKPAPAPWGERLSAAMDHDYFRLLRRDAQPLAAGQLPPYRDVLLQLHEPRRNPLAASAFMPSAQRLNLIAPIERWVIGKLFATLGGSRRPADAAGVYAIQLSPVTLADGGFITFLTAQGKHDGIQPQRICFEIAEDDLVQNFSLVQQFMQAGKERGYRFCMSRFGGGISSFAYVRNLPLDFLKIDSSLTGRVDSDPIDAAIVRAIQGIGQHLNVRLIAQDVDSQPLGELLGSLGIHYAQGPIAGDPVPLETPPLAAAMPFK